MTSSRLPFLRSTRRRRRGRDRVAAPVRPCCEALEDRTVLSTFSLTGSLARFQASAGVANDLTLAVAGSYLVLTDTAERIFLANAPGCTGDGTNRILCPVAAFSEIDLNCLDGNDTVNVLPLGLDAIVRVASSEALALTLDDSNDPGARQPLLDAGSVVGLACPLIDYSACSLNSLTINGGSGGNRFTVTDTGAAFTTVIHTGAGPNSALVQGTTGMLTLAGQGGSDRVVIGAPVASTGGTDGLGRRSLARILGNITVTNSRPVTDLIVDDSGVTAATHAVFSDDGANGQISGADPTPLGQYGAPDPAAPFAPAGVAIGYADAALHSLTIEGGSGGNTFAVAGTGAGFTTNLASGTGQDIVMVQATSGPLNLEGQDGRDQVIFGQWPQTTLDALASPGGSLHALRGAVSVSNDLSLTDINVDDGGGSPQTSFVLETGAIHVRANGAADTIDILYAPSEVNSLALRAGAGGNNFTINDSVGDVPTTIRTGNGDNVDVLADAASLKVLDANGSDRLAVQNAPYFEHLVSQGPLAPTIAPDGSFTADVSGTINAIGDQDLYEIDVPGVPGKGVLKVSITPAAGSMLDCNGALLSADSILYADGASTGGGGLLAFSAGSAGQAGPTLVQYVFAGPYYVKVSSGGMGARATGAFTVSVSFTPADDPYAKEITSSITYDVGVRPSDLALADFNHDGVIDLAVADLGAPTASAGDVAVLLGVGDGSFLPAKTFPVYPGYHPQYVVSLDYNHDGRPDLAAWDPISGYVDILLGLGDGTFSTRDLIHLTAQDARQDAALATLFVTSALAGPPVATSNDNAALLGIRGPLVRADFNADGTLDFAAVVQGATSGVVVGIQADANAKGFVQYGPVTDLVGGPNPVSNVLNNFSDLAVGVSPSITAPSQATPVLADVDGTTGVFEVNRAGAILFRAEIPGQPGGFEPPATINDVAVDPARAIAVLDGDPAHPQVAAIAAGSGRVFVYSAQVVGGRLTWTRTFNQSTGNVFRPVRIAAGFINGDNLEDLVVADGLQGSLLVYVNQGDGNFRLARQLKAGITISNLTLLPRPDHYADILITDEASGDVSIFTNEQLAQGQVGFTDEARFRAGLPAAGFGIDESVVSTVANMLLDNQLLPALATQLAQLLAQTRQDLLPVSNLLDSVRGPAADFGISVPTLPNVPDPPPPAQFTPTVAIPYLNQLVQFFSQLEADFMQLSQLLGQYGPTLVLFQLVSPDDLSAITMELNAAERRLAGFNNVKPLPDVPLFPDPALTILGGLDPYHQLLPPTFFVFSDLGTSAAISTDLEGVGAADLIALNRTADDLVILKPKFGPDGVNTGGFLDPQPADILPTGAGPQAVVAGNFTTDGKLDLAVLNTGDDTIWIYTRDAFGRLMHSATLSAGTNPTGLSVASVRQSGIEDLMVGNTYGDLQVLLGKGDGTFQPFEPIALKKLALVDSRSGNNFIVSDQPSNQLVATNGLDGPIAFQENSQNGIVAPSAVKVVTTAGVQYVVVANSGANDILVYRIVAGLPDPSTMQTLAAGTDPEGITVANLKNDHSIDLIVANKGSNDVSLFFVRARD